MNTFSHMWEHSLANHGRPYQATGIYTLFMYVGCCETQQTRGLFVLFTFGVQDSVLFMKFLEDCHISQLQPDK